MKNEKYVFITSIVILFSTLNLNNIRKIEAVESAITQNKTRGVAMKLDKFEEQIFLAQFV